VQDVAATLPVTNASVAGSFSNPFASNYPPSIHGAVSSDDSSSSDEDEGKISEAKRRRKDKMNTKIDKRAWKLTKKRIKKECEKHPFFGIHQVPPKRPITVFFFSISIHSLGTTPYFDGTDYPKRSYDMKMHLYGLDPSIWEVVCVGVTPPKHGVPTTKQEQDYFHNAQAVRVITSSLCVLEFNKVRNVEIAKKIWDTLREALRGLMKSRRARWLCCKEN
jgi:hypothetical protein